MSKDESSLFDGIDTSLSALANFAGPNPPERLTRGFAAIVDQARRAQQAFDSGNDSGVAGPVEAGLAAVRALRSLAENSSRRELAIDRVDGDAVLSSPLRAELEQAGFQREYLGLVLRLPPLTHPRARSA